MTGMVVILGNIGGVLAQSSADVASKLGCSPREGGSAGGELGTYILGVLAAVVEDEKNLDLQRENG